MTKDQFYSYQRQTFDAFAKKVCRNEQADFFREIARRRKYEEELDGMSHKAQSAIRSEDSYFSQSWAFSVLGITVEVRDSVLGEILQFIPAQHRDIVLLYYFLELTDNEIGTLLHTSKTTVHYRRVAALRRLKQLLEALDYE